MHNPSAAIVALLALSGIVRAQGYIEPRREIVDRVMAPETVAFLGDVDQDGYDDFAVASPLAWFGGVWRSGMVQVFSGLTGAQIGPTIAGGYNNQLGTSFAPVGDVNADGVPDMIFTAPYAGAMSNGLTYVYSGSGAWIRTHPGRPSAVGSAGDVNGDGHDDYLVGYDAQSASPPQDGVVRVHSGADGSILSSYVGTGGVQIDSNRFGAAVATADVDGDGIGDHVIGAPGVRSTTQDPMSPGDAGAVFVFSGLTGAQIALLWGDDPLPGNWWAYSFGEYVANVGDLNGDGRDEIGCRYRNQFGVLAHFFDVTASPGTPMFSWVYARTFGPAGDVNGDGIQDMVVADSGWRNGSNQVVGRAWVYSRGSLSTLWEFRGGEGIHNGIYIGKGIGGGGDINGDGFGDFVMGVSGGRVQAFLGRPPLEQRFEADGSGNGDQFGYAVAGAGDCNGDGFDDIVVGALTDDDTNGADCGSARVISGIDGTQLHEWFGDAANDRLGVAVDGAGDVNGDGFADVIVGAYQASSPAPHVNAGMARVYSGSDGAVLFTWYGDAPTDNFGRSVAGVGDVDDDGYDDLLVGAFRGDTTNGIDSGYARVFSGRDGSVIRTLLGATAGEAFGYCVAGAGDTNGDGTPDMIVGAFSADGPGGVDSGSARLISGTDGADLQVFWGDSANDFFGQSVDGGGAVAADGLAEVIVGAPTTTASLDAYARVFRGDGSLLYDLDAYGIPPSPYAGYFGAAACGAGDVNGDGYDDLLVGSYGIGRAQLYSGFDGGAMLYRLNDGVGGAGFGRSVASAGDTNGDGQCEVVVGAYQETTPSIGTTGAVHVFGTDYSGPGVIHPSIERAFGAGCPDSTGRLPHAGNDGRPRIGSSFDVTLRAAQPFTPALLLFGFASADVPLAPLLGGAFLIGPDCRLLVDPTGASLLSHVADAAGRARFTQAVPNDPAIQGAELFAQWLVFDIPGSVGSLALVTSDGMRSRIGSP